MWVIIDWTDTQVVGIFNSYEYAHSWLKDYWAKNKGTWISLDSTECSIHRIINVDDATIRVNA